MILGWPDWANHTLGAALLVMFAWSMVWASRIDDDRYGGLRMFQKKESPKNDPDVARPIDVWQQTAGRCLPRYTFACFDCGVEYADTTDNRFDAFVYSVAGIEAGLDGWIVVKFCKACWKARLGNGGHRPGAAEIGAKRTCEWPGFERRCGIDATRITRGDVAFCDHHHDYALARIQAHPEPSWWDGNTAMIDLRLRLLGEADVTKVDPSVPDPVPAVPRLRAVGPRAMKDVENERFAQDVQWGGPAHDDEHRCCDWIDYVGKFLDRATHTPGRYRDSMVKIAALAIAAVESFDRKSNVTGEPAPPDVTLDLVDARQPTGPTVVDTVTIDRGSGHMTACRPGLCAERCPQPRPIIVPGHTLMCRPTRCAAYCKSPTTIVSASGESDDRLRYS